MSRTAEHWNDRYRTGNLPWDTRRPEPLFVQRIPELNCPTRRAIDLGCGAGDSTTWLAEYGFEAIGLDVSSVAVDMARDRAAERGVTGCRFECASITQPLPVEAGSVGLAIDRGCYHAIDEADREHYVNHLAHAMAPGAWWLLMCGNADEDRPADTVGPPQLNAAQIVDPTTGRFELHSLSRAHLAGSDNDEPEHLAWLAMFRRRC